jgi:hypothetical protein
MVIEVDDEAEILDIKHRQSSSNDRSDKTQP